MSRDRTVHRDRTARFSRRRVVDVVPELPLITAIEISARRQAGQLGRVEVYPIPESVLPGTPSVLVRPAPTPVPVVSSLRPRSGARSGNSAPYRFVIDGRETLVQGAFGVIGRSPDPTEDSQAIAVTDPGRSLSRNHLGFEVDARGRLLVVDLRSANGSEILAASGERTECVPGRRYVVGNGDALLLGNFDVKVARG